MYETGEHFFNTYYEPWLDATDGLYRAQPTFQDPTSSGYPKGYTIKDCVLLKGASTNCIYYGALNIMAKAAKNIGLPKEKQDYWSQKAKALYIAIKKELMNEDGTLVYYKDRTGKVQNNQHNLGSALAVLHNVVEGEEAKKMVGNYPLKSKGIPLYPPLFIYK